MQEDYIKGTFKNKIKVPKPNYRIMYWDNENSGGWYYVHDQESGDPVECETPKEVQNLLMELVIGAKSIYELSDLKVVKEYPVRFDIQLGGY